MASKIGCKIRPDLLFYFRNCEAIYSNSGTKHKSETVNGILKS